MWKSSRIMKELLQREPGIIVDLMDMNTLNPGQDFEELPESYVIFITRDDILGYGLPIYHIDRQIKEIE